MKGEINPNFYLPTQIYIDQNLTSNIGNIVKKYGSKVVIITTSTDMANFSETIAQISKNIINANLGCIIYDEISDIPDTEYVDSAVYFTKKTNCDIILGFGGVESINVAKAVSILTNNHLFCNDLFTNPEVNPPVTLLTMPVQPIFGFEIVPILYLSEIQKLTKKIYINNYLFPKATIIDSQLSTQLDDETTASSAISTLAISIESVISRMNNDFINTYALKSIDLLFKNLLLAYQDPKDPNPRAKLSLASVLAGIALTTTESSLCLALSLALSSQVNIPIAKSMGILLPHVMEFNLTTSTGKYVQMLKVMDESLSEITVIEAAIKAIEGVRKLENDVDVPQKLSQYDISKNDFAKAAEIAFAYPFIENVPRPLTRDEIETILIAAF